MIRRSGMVLIAGLAVWGCSPPARSVTYFTANPDEADRVSAACKAGTESGDECGLAAQAVAKRTSDQVFDQATKMTENKPAVGRKW